MADILENPVDLIDDAYEQEIQVEQEMIEVVAYRSYNQLDDKPQINGVELVGNKTSSDLGITAQIESAINSEAQARAQADNTLQGKIDTEKLARQQADSTLQGNIDAEETARKAADKDIQDVLDGETLARQNADTALGGRIDTEIHDRQVADIGLQGQIDAITSKSDVVDVVANYAALQAYDTSTLGNNDVVKVLDDETHEDALTYYRWSTTTQTWSYIGQEAPYYSKGQMDVKLAEKQDKLTAGANIQIQNGTISATDTTYTAGNGLNLNGTEFSADTDVLATKEDLEGYYTKPEADNLLAPKLEAEVVTELPTTGEEGKLYLTPKAHTTQTASGNPISVNITDNAGKIESFQLDGDTFQQSYTGKNLFNKANVVNGIPSASDGSITSTSGVGRTSDYISVIPNTAYSHTGHPLGWATIAWYKSDKSFIERTDNVTTTTSPNEAAYARVSCAQGNLDTCQFEIGQPTAYEPYVGGQPSPNPSYPQDVNVVTGTQTISINGTNYPISLGSIELFSSTELFSSSSDYIHKDGDNWKVHKGTGKVTLDGSESWTKASANSGYRFWTSKATDIKTSLGAVLKANRLGVPRGDTWDNYGISGSYSINQTRLYIRDALFNDMAEEQLRSWLATHNIIAYYALATPTDTVITDQALITQLEAIRTASLETGTNTISNTATGTNLAGDMELGYYEFDPTNRYDKFIWLDLNNNYEQIGGE